MLMVLCQRPGCEGVGTARDHTDHRRRRYCSTRCAALMTQNWRAAQRAQARATATRRAQVLARIQTLPPVEAFRLGYDRGLRSKWRQLRQRYHMVPRQKALP